MRHQWNGVWNARSKIRDYAHADDTPAAVAEAMMERLELMDEKEGWWALHALSVLTEPLDKLIMATQGDTGSGMVIPTVHAVQLRWNELLNDSARLKNDGQEYLRLKPATLAVVKESAEALFDKYLAPLFEDEIFLAAFYLDAGNWKKDGPIHKYASEKFFNRAGTTVKAMLQDEYDKREEARAARNAALQAEAVPPLLRDEDQAMEPAVAVALAALGAEPLPVVSDEMQLDPARYADVSKEFSKLSNELASGKFDGMDLFQKVRHDNGWPLVLATQVALNVLAVPPGEAKCERRLSASGRLKDKKKARMTPKTQSKLTLLHANKHFRAVTGKRKRE
jgi:hypothetical protein